MGNGTYDNPLEGGRSISSDVADLVKLIESSGLDYRMTAFGTLVEGSWTWQSNATSTFGRNASGY